MKLTIWHGREVPLVAVGKNQARMLGFAARFPGWHYHANDRATLRAIDGLKRRNVIEVDAFGRFRINWRHA
jgi:hypothetical protein